MDSTVPENQWLDRAFKLAWFINCDKEAAIRVATAAMSKLEIASAAQDKRLYYTPTGRASARKSRNKILLGEAHLLQRLIYVESETYEREKEQRGLPDEEDMIIHFVKHLARITIKRNSFYVALGLSRLLHNYSTSETQDIYNAVVQDPDRVRDDYYFRSRKAQLMREMKERFGDLLKVCRGQRGEERFHCEERQESHVNLVEKCLSFFTPWNTPCLVSAGFDPFKDMVPQFTFNGDEPDHEHEVEINRMHAILDPECYRRLTGALRLDQPQQRLDIPHFFLSGQTGSGNGGRGTRHHLPDLADEEALRIAGTLADEAARRRAAVAGLLRVFVDGSECARLDPRRVGNVRFPVEEGAELIEVHTDDGKGDLLLAVHALALDETDNENRASRRAIVLESGQELSFSVMLDKDLTDEAPQAYVTLAYRETNPLRAASLLLQRFGCRVSEHLRVNRWAGSSIMKPALAFAFLILCAVILTFYLQSRRFAAAGIEVANRNQNIVSPGEALPSAPPLSSVVTTTVDEQTAPLRVNSSMATGKQKTTGRTPKKAPTAEVAKLEEALPSENTLTEDEATRALRIERIAASLPSVKRIYVESIGDEPAGQELRNLLISALRSNPRFTLITNRDEADALLKLSVRRDQSNAKAVVIARLVNANGEVIWPITPRGSGAKYQGPAVSIAARIMEDLFETVRVLESNRN